MKRQKQADQKRDRFILEDLESNVQQTNMKKAN